MKELFEQLEQIIQNAYISGVTIVEAETLAAQFLHAQLKVAAELARVELDARMRKAGVKGVRAAIYLDAATKDPKKPSDVMLAAIVDTNDVVQSEQNELDKAEVKRDELERYYNIFRESHIYFRGISKGKFD